MVYKTMQVSVHLHASDIDRLRLLLDLEWRRIQDESPYAFDEPTSYASAINKLRWQFIHLQDSNLAPEGLMNP